MFSGCITALLPIKIDLMLGFDAVERTAAEADRGVLTVLLEIMGKIDFAVFWASFVLFSLLSVTSCSFSGLPPSLGDSPVHRIKCPNFEAWQMCVARAENRHCEGAPARLLSPSAKELEKDRTDGQTVPIEGRINRRIITIICEG